jgi:hypothetical protein
MSFIFAPRSPSHGCNIRLESLPGMSAEGERHDMVEFVIIDPSRVYSGILQQLLLNAVGIARGRPHGLGIAGYADRLVDRFLVGAGIQRNTGSSAAVRNGAAGAASVGAAGETTDAGRFCEAVGSWAQSK